MTMTIIEALTVIANLREKFYADGDSCNGHELADALTVIRSRLEVTDENCPVCGDPLAGDDPCKPPIIGWMLRDQEGYTYFDECCIWLNREDAQEAADGMLEPDGDVYTPFPIVAGEAALVAALGDEK